MGSVKTDVTVTGVSDMTAFDLLSDFECYSKLTDVVRNVTVSQHDGESISSWEVNFRRGILKWTELDTFDRERREIRFVQTEGDPKSFSGLWRITPVGADTIVVTFEADFDLGMPTIASIVDPIAERTLVENTRMIIEQLTGHVTGKQEAAEAETLP
jgi:ribosome-associated toxin RatA of RatAB toxin-antitoxin module